MTEPPNTEHDDEHGEGSLEALPLEVQARVDVLADAVRGGREEPEALAYVTDWIEEHASAAIFDYAEPNIRALALADVRSRFEWVNEAEAAEHLSVAGQRITDAHRVRYLEDSYLDAMFEDADTCSFFSPLQVSASNGSDVVLVKNVKGYSFTQITVTWHGAYTSFDDFVNTLSSEDWTLDTDRFRSLSMKQKLRLLRER